MVRARRRPSRKGSACNEALRGDGPLAKQLEDLCAEHQARMRSQPQEAPDRLSRSLPDASHQLYREGKIIYVGSSNFAGWHIAKANEAAKRRNFLGLVSEQSIYSLVNRNIELEVIPACEDYGLGLIPWSPLAGGALAGLKREGERVKNPRIQDRLKRDHDKFEAFEQLCKQIGEAPADVALAWVLMNPVVTAPIIGPRTLDQLEGSIRSLEIKLEDEVMKKLDVIFPGPGGTAPEAYAW
jgi:aryl-alcohol dehydrogenase-like predicted oxidoreductase